MRTGSFAALDPEIAWWRIKGARQFRGHQAGVAQCVAAWRERRAREVDRQPRFVLSDLTLAAIAARPPTSVTALAQLRGAESLPRPVAQAVFDAVETGTGLDPAARQNVWQRILDLRGEFGTTVLMTTHDMREAEYLCDRVAFLHRGKLLADGSPDELKATLGPEATLDDVFVKYAGVTVAEGGTLRDVSQVRRTAKRL